MSKLHTGSLLFGLFFVARALYAQDPPPQTLHEKFMSYAVLTVGPRALVTPAFSASVRLVNPFSEFPHDWRRGPAAFGKNYGDGLASLSAMKTGRFVTGALLHEDFRYRPSAGANPWARILHALAFTVVDRSDSGHRQFAAANFVAAGAGGFVGMLYLPPGYRNANHAELRGAIVLGGFAAQNMLHEFTPELLKLKHKFHHSFPAVFSGGPIPKWWTSRAN